MRAIAVHLALAHDKSTQLGKVHPANRLLVTYFLGTSK